MIDQHEGGTAFWGVCLGMCVFFAIIFYEDTPEAKAQKQLSYKQYVESEASRIQQELLTKPGFEDCIATLLDGSKLVRCPNSQTTLDIRVGKTKRQITVDSK